MKQAGNNWISHFVNGNNIPLVVDDRHAVFTVCCRSDVKFGGHAFCIMEWFEYGSRRQSRYDLLTSGSGRIQLHEARIKTSNWDVIENRMETTKHHSYQLSYPQARAVNAAFMKFKGKSERGRYVYCKEGGVLGRVLGVFTGQRGVNCADLVIKILNDAGITKVLDNLYNTPKFAASGKHG